MLKVSSCNIDILGSGFNDIYTHIINYKGENPYTSCSIVFDKEYSIILRKELIELLNDGNFNIDVLVRNDIEIQFSKFKYISVYLKAYNNGRKLYKKVDLCKSEEEFKKAHDLLPEDVIAHVLKIGK
jgi:hypothetical protein